MPTKPSHESTATETSLVAWGLLLMGLATFVPCIILPEWRDYQHLCQDEQAERHRYESLKRVVNHERLALQAMQTDPAVLARMAQRELGYRQVGRQAVRVNVPAPDRIAEKPFTPTPVEPPAMVSRILSMLPDLDYDKVFIARGPRITIMAMSVTLMVIAVLLGGSKGESRRV